MNGEVFNKKQRDKGFLKLFLGEERVVFYTNHENYEYNNLDEFLNSKSHTYYEQVIYLDKRTFGVVYKYCVEERKQTPKKLTEPVYYGYVIDNPKRAYKKIFYSLVYKCGTDEFKTTKDKVNAIEQAPVSSQAGYTSILRQILKTDEKLIPETVGPWKPSLSPLIFAKRDKEFIDVQCWDITSFYPFLLTQELPHFDKRITKYEVDWNDTRYTYFGAIRVRNIKAKTPFLTLSLIGNEKGEIEPKQGKDIVRDGTRLISATVVDLCGFLPFLFEELEDYNYDSCEIATSIWRFKLEPDEKISSVILDKFAIKQAKKRAGEYYQPEKILLNRCYGYFITKGLTTPAHYGQYIVAKGKTILRRLALEIGIKDIVHIHTDSIKFRGPHSDIIEKYNKTIPFEELGKFCFEGSMEKVIYYKTNVAKYLMNGELCFKHGGIEPHDIAPLYKLNYADITKETEFFLTTQYFYVKDFGFYPYRTKRKLGGKINE